MLAMQATIPINFAYQKKSQSSIGSMYVYMVFSLVDLGLQQ